MSRDTLRNQRLDRRTEAGVAAGARAALLHDSFCPAPCSPVQADEPLSIADRELLVQYRIALLERTGKVFTGEDENFLTILGKTA